MLESQRHKQVQIKRGQTGSYKIIPVQLQLPAAITVQRLGLESDQNMLKVSSCYNICESSASLTLPTQPSIQLPFSNFSFSLTSTNTVEQKLVDAIKNGSALLFSLYWFQNFDEQQERWEDQKISSWYEVVCKFGKG